jgi:hypothetical protein
MKRFHQRFAVPPANPNDLHRPFNDSENLAKWALNVLARLYVDFYLAPTKREKGILAYVAQ